MVSRVEHFFLQGSFFPDTPEYRLSDGIVVAILRHFSNNEGQGIAAERPTGRE
jgi:hypothetical protein